MRAHLLTRQQRLPGAPSEVFAFFAAARNLEAITPPWLAFRVVTPEPIAMGAGTLIAYRLRLHGVPVRWLTRIETWEPGVRFVDAQLRGPYRLWHHTHEFAPDPRDPGMTLMRDSVRWALPLGPLGAPALPLVRRDLRRIFDHRSARVAALLGAPTEEGLAKPPRRVWRNSSRPVAAGHLGHLFRGRTPESRWGYPNAGPAPAREGTERFKSPVATGFSVRTGQ